MRSQGFTIIELLVVTAVMAVLMGGALVMINRFNSTQKVRSAKEELVSNLALARNYARGMQMPEGLSGNLKYVTISWDGGLNMVISAMTDVGVSGIFTSKKLVQGGGVAVSPTLNPGTLCFAAYEAKLVAANGSPVDVGASFSIVAVEGIGGTEVVTVSTSGLINEK
jgi:prepilin-type N-terminal cleavage/methylation domain-containing protein